MLFIFLPARTTLGIEVTINPQQVASIEPVTGKEDSECVVRMAMNLAQQEPNTGQWMIGHMCYILSESRDTFVTRVIEAQRDAQNSWWAGAKEMQKALQESLDDTSPN